jgi:hypothetical protein
MTDNLCLTKQQLDLLKFMQDGGTVHVVYMPFVYAGGKPIGWAAYLKLLQYGLVASEDKGTGVENITLTDEGKRVTALRRVSEKVVKELKRYKQLELVEA